MNSTCSVDQCMDVCNLACTYVDCPDGAVVDDEREDFSPAQFEVLKVVSAVAATLSVCGSAFIIRTFHMILSHRPVALHIVYWLSVSDLVSSFTYIVDASTKANEDSSPNCPNGLCVFLGASTQFFGVAAIVWNTLIAFNMHLTVLLVSRIVQEENRYLIKLHVIAWSTALVTTLVTGAAGGLGSAGQWCWITKESAWARWLFFYALIIVSLIYSLVIYLRVRQRIIAARRQAGNDCPEKSSALPELMARFQAFLCVYGLIHCFRILNRLQELAQPDSPSFVLALLHSIFGPMQGLGNALVYGWTPRVRRLYATRYPQWCSCLNDQTQPREHTPPSLVQAPPVGSGTGREIEATQSAPDI